LDDKQKNAGNLGGALGVIQAVKGSPCCKGAKSFFLLGVFALKGPFFNREISRFGVGMV
jgi:hypothetical protein